MGHRLPLIDTGGSGATSQVCRTMSHEQGGYGPTCGRGRFQLLRGNLTENVFCGSTPVDTQQEFMHKK